MTIYSCHYPITVTLNTDETDQAQEIIEGKKAKYKAYSVHMGNKKLHQGRVYSTTVNSENIPIDISPFCREVLQTFYKTEKLKHPDTDNTPVYLADYPYNEETTTIGTFYVRDAKGTNIASPLSVMYNYNTEYQSTYEDNFILNNPLLLEADPRQLLTLSAYNLNGANKYIYYIHGKNPQSQTRNSKVFQLYTLNLNLLNLSPGDKVTICCNPNSDCIDDTCCDPDNSFTYTIVPPCRNRYALYYINKNGGLDNLLCRGKHIESFKGTPTSVDLYSNRSNRLNAQNTKISQRINKKYQLNTSILQDESASHMDELIFSPKIWIHDLDNQTITSCTIDETNCTVKNFRNNKIVTYQINITESQEYLRK